jgi:hypothetical protein
MCCTDTFGYFIDARSAINREKFAFNVRENLARSSMSAAPAGGYL